MFASLKSPKNNPKKNHPQKYKKLQTPKKKKKTKKPFRHFSRSLLFQRGKEIGGTLLQKGVLEGEKRVILISLLGKDNSLLKRKNMIKGFGRGESARTFKGLGSWAWGHNNKGEEQGGKGHRKHIVEVRERANSGKL